MRAVLQRVRRAAVRVEGVTVSTIGPGYLVLVGVEAGDGDADLEYLLRKIAGLRLWPDADGRMDEPLGERAVLVVSQFTLLADTRRGLRPSYDRAAPAAEARARYDALVAGLHKLGIAVATGVFQAHMEVELVNEGPVTICLDSRG